MSDPGDFDDDFDDGDDDELEDDFDCHLDMRTGQCGAAGSEWCDFECPHRDSEFFAGSAAWNKKHAKGK